MSITSLGAVYSETLLGGPVDLTGSAASVVASAGLVKASAKLASDIGVLVDAVGLAKSSVALIGPTDIVVSTEAELTQLFAWLKSYNVQDYTIFPPLGNHKELANLNLISQFKDCPNILNFLDIAFQELDKASQDILDFQSVLDVDLATGAILDILGAIVGVRRLTGQDDIIFRDRIKAQILVNNCDTTLRSTLLALLANYRMAPDERSKHEIDLRTGVLNEAILYVRDFETVTKHGGYQFVDKLTAGGANTKIVVNKPETAPAGYFGLEGSNGFGIGSLDDPSIGGEIVGTYNRDKNAEIELQFGLLDAFDNYGLSIGHFVSSLVTQDSASTEILTGEETPTTTSQIGVDTFN